MNKISRLFALSVVLTASLLRGEPTNALSPAERAAGWTLLFDGSSLAGWRGLKTETPGAGWKVIDGALVTPGKAGDLVTGGEFGDFELTAEWKVAEGSNSGIIYRVGVK